MSEIETSDLLGLSAPLTKLVETAAAGIGRLYEPTHIRRMAKAKVEEINLISEAIRQNPELPVKYEDGKLVLDGTDCTELARRAQERFLFQEFKKQNNLDHIVAEAAKTLDETPSVDARKVDDDWISHFFDAAAHVSNEEMQKVWGKVLAGEITSGGSYSIRTIELLKTFDQNDAILLSKIASLFLFGDRLCFIPSNENFLKKWGVSYDNLLKLGNSGMINIHPFQQFLFRLGNNGCGTIKNNNDWLIVINNGNKEFTVKYGAYFLTQAAIELHKLVLPKGNHDYMRELVEDIKKSNPNGSEISYQLQLSSTE